MMSVLIFNSETRGRLTDKDMKRLEGVDRMLLRQIFQVPISTPIPALYLETGCIPVRYVMRMKRILFLHHILTRAEHALITRAFWAQVENPTKGDWCIVVKEDLDSIGLSDLTYEAIKNTKGEVMKQLVKAKIKETAFNDLVVEKEKNSKLFLFSFCCGFISLSFHWLFRYLEIL